MNGADNEPTTNLRAIPLYLTLQTMAMKVGPFPQVKRAKPQPEKWRRTGKKGGKQKQYF